MNTYYELITFINSIKNNETLDESIIEKLNNFNINLENERYNRFINHITNLLDERINIHYENIYNKLDNTNNEKNFENIINSIIRESKNQIKFINNNLIKDEEKDKLYNFIKENNNEIINRLKKYYSSHKNIINYLDNYYMS